MALHARPHALVADRGRGAEPAVYPIQEVNNLCMHEQRLHMVSCFMMVKARGSGSLPSNLQTQTKPASQAASLWKNVQVGPNRPFCNQSLLALYVYAEMRKQLSKECKLGLLRGTAKSRGALMP